MTPENQGRFLRALVAKVSVDDKVGSCTVELVNFDAATSTSHQKGGSVSDAEVSEQRSKNTGDSEEAYRKGPLFRHRSRRVALNRTPPENPEPVRRPVKVARQLALAYHLQTAIDLGTVANRATLAGKLGLTRARITLLLDLLMLAPDLQDAVLRLEAVNGVEPMAERTLRRVAHAGTWTEQRAT